MYIFLGKDIFGFSRFLLPLSMAATMLSLSLSHKKPLSPGRSRTSAGRLSRRRVALNHIVAPAHKSQTTSPTYQQLRKDLLAPTDNTNQPSRLTRKRTQTRGRGGASSRRAPNKQHASEGERDAPPYERPPIFFLRKLVFGMRPRRCEIEGSKMWSTLVPDPPVGATYCGCMPRTS